jgi:predicted choloylglycine hydrolase
MNIKTFKGSFFEIGQQQGKIYKKNGMSFDDVKIDPVIYRNQLKVYQKYYPEFLEQLKGMAIGGDFNQEKLIYSFITNELVNYKRRFGLDKACTIFGYKDKNDLFVGRNYDWIPETEKVFEVYKIVLPKRNSYMAFSDMSLGSSTKTDPKYLSHSVDDIINDKGLFIGLTFAFCEKWSYGISFIHIINLIAETCTTVSDAIKVFEKIPICAPKNFFIADKNGNMAVVEHTSKKFKVIYPKSDVLIQTNHYIDPLLAKEDTVLKRMPFHNTFIRYYETLQKINIEKPTFNFDSIIKILGRKGSYTCQDFPTIKTIWTLGLDMKNKKYKIYWNHFGTRKSKDLKF